MDVESSSDDDDDIPVVGRPNSSMLVVALPSPKMSLGDDQILNCIMNTDQLRRESRTSIDSFMTRDESRY